MACWINKATETHSEYVTLTALPQQQWLKRMRLNFTLYNNTEHYTIRISGKVPSNPVTEGTVDSGNNVNRTLGNVHRIFGH